jgi:hypothetical protein
MIFRREKTKFSKMRVCGFVMNPTRVETIVLAGDLIRCSVFDILDIQRTTLRDIFL